MDETFDMWTTPKMRLRLRAATFPSGGSATSRRWSPRTSTTRASILYSIGNEIPETGTPAGATLGRRLAEKVRSLDDTRFVTNGVNALLAVRDPELDELLAADGAEVGRRRANAQMTRTSTR